MAAPVPATLKCLVPPGSVTFDFNPEKVVVTRTAKTSMTGSASSNGGTPAGSRGTVFRGAPPSQIKLQNVTFSGRDTKSRCDQLLAWMSPGGGLLGAIAGAALAAATGINLASKLPMVIFEWGPPDTGFMYQCNVLNATITYTRFAPTGIPVRADVSITLQEQPSLLGMLATNPTSGGLPGRRAHTVTAGESLVGIATEQYGTPAAWRPLAESNGIDDPLRVRAGDRLLLPHPDDFPAATP